MAIQLSRIRTDLEQFAEALSREEYAARAGRKTESCAAAVRERFGLLADGDAFAEVRGAARSARDPADARRTGFLAEFLGTTCVEYQARAMTDRLAAAETKQVFGIDGESVPFRSAESRLRNEEERASRGAIEAARLRAVAGLNGLRRDILDAHHREIQRLGFPGYAAFCSELSGIDLAALCALTQPLLPRTQAMYADALAWFLRRRLGIHPHEARRHDLARLFRAPELDGSLVPENLREAAEAPLRRMGIDPLAGGRILVDDAPRPNKAPRAFVATPRIPDEVILVVRRSGGPDDYAAYLHELGHALHFAYTDPGLPVEDRRLGDPSVTEAFAFLWDGQLRERGWLKRFGGVGHPRDLLRFGALHKLWLLRRYAAKLAYELLLHSDGPGPRAALAYRDLLSEAALVEWPAETYLADVDPFFYAARYLRAWIFEAQLREHLRERFDEEWFRNDRAKPFLLALWRRGQRDRLEDLAVELRLGPPSLDPLISQIAADLT